MIVEIILSVDSNNDFEDYQIREITYAINEACSIIEREIKGDRFITYKVKVDGKDYECQY